MLFSEFLPKVGCLEYLRELRRLLPSLSKHNSVSISLVFENLRFAYFMTAFPWQISSIFSGLILPEKFSSFGVIAEVYGY